MKASVVICAHNEEDTIEDCVKSVINQDCPNEDYEVIVVDDGSEDKTPQILESFSEKIRCFRNEKNQGIPYSRNWGVKEARGEIICFIDGDAYADKAWLRNLLTAYDGGEIDGRVFPKELLGGVGGFVGAWNKDKVVARYSEEGGVRLFRIQQGSKVILSQMGFATCNIAYPKSLIEKVGGFDEGLIVGSDTDLNLRIIELGYVFVYNPHARVHHKHPESVLELMGRWFVRGRYDNKIIEKHPKLNLNFARIISPRDFAKEALSHLTTPLFILIDFLVRISFLAGLMFNKLES